MHTVRVCFAWLFVLNFIGCSLAAQQVERVSFVNREFSEFPEGFTRIAAVHELGNGRVLVVDDLARSVQLLDLTAATAAPVSRVGRGPMEFILPSRLFRLRGDSAALLDRSANRSILIFVHGAPVAAYRWSESGGRGGAPQAIDLVGRMYAAGRRVVAPNGKRSDSVAIERWQRGSAKRDTVTFVDLSDLPSLVPLGRSGGLAPSTESAFERTIDWCVAPDGAIAIASAEPYRIVFVDSSGRRAGLATLRADRIPVSDAHKKAWLDNRSLPVLVARRGADGSTAYELQRGTSPKAVNWPSHLPAFLVDAVTCSPNGNVWIKRTTATVDSSKYDVFDISGHYLRQVVFPHRTRIIGFGDRTLYVVRIDAEDVQFIRRYAYP
jgi:hypothetical protein